MASNQTTLTMSELIDETLDELYRTTERPRLTLMTVAINATSTALTVDSVSAASMAETDVLEFELELMLVTAVSGQTITVSRAYLGTSGVAHIINTPGNINTQYPRYRVDRDIRRCFQSLVTTLPNVFSATFPPPSDNGQSALLPLDEECMEVLDVRYMESRTSKVSKLRRRWKFQDNLPTDVSYTGKALVVPSQYRNKDLIVTYQLAYVWAGSGETATIKITVGGENLPVLFAVAKLQTGMEISRSELDQAEEWPTRQDDRRDPTRLLRTLWGRYYQRLDEVTSTRNMPRIRDYDRVASGL